MRDPGQATLRRARLAARFSFFAAGFGMASWAPLVPFVKARLAVDDGVFGLFLLCLGIGSLIAMPATGIIASRIGSRPAIAAGGIGLAAMLPLLAMMDQPLLLAAALMVFGASLGMIDVAINIHAVEVEGRSGEALMSGFHGMFSLGGLAGAGGGTLLLSAGAGPLAAAATGALITLTATGIAFPGLLNERAEQRGPTFAVPHGVVVLIGLLAFCAFLTEGAILDWSALFAVDELRMPARHGGIGYAVFAIAMTIGRLTGDRVVARLGAAPTLLWGGLTVVAGFAWLLTVPFAPVAMAGYLLIGLGAANLVPVLFSAAGRQTTMPAPLAVASVTTLGYAGVLIGPALIGLVSDLTGLRTAFALLAILMLAVPLCRSLLPTERT